MTIVKKGTDVHLGSRLTSRSEMSAVQIVHLDQYEIRLVISALEAAMEGIEKFYRLERRRFRDHRGF